jgi:hypothetical protein
VEMEYPPVEIPATPDYVLEVFRDFHRHECACGEADPELSLSFDTTIAEWTALWDFFNWRELAASLNESWGINCDLSDWRKALMPADERRLGDVCRLIARSAHRPAVRPARLAGRVCRPAGAFLTVRALLQEAGAPAETIAPSTPLAPFARRYCDVFLGPVSRLAPGALPPVRIYNPVVDAASWAFAAGLLCLVTGLCGRWHGLTGAGVLALAGAYALLWFFANRPASVEFGELHTFRDLAMVIAAGSPAEPDADGGPG